MPAGPLAAGGFETAIDTALPRVVKLYGLGAGREAGYGTGALVSADGLVLTVFSLLIDAPRLRAITADGTTCEADVVHVDRVRQLALLSIRCPDVHRSATLPNGGSTAALQDEITEPSDPRFPFFDVLCEGSAEEPCGPDLRPGDWVLAAGNAHKVADGAEPVSIAHGIFSTRTRLDARRRVKDFSYTGDVLMIDAITSNPGAPGSPLVNLDGRFVGLIGREVVSNLTHTHVNYALPRDVIARFMAEAQAVRDGAAMPRTAAEQNEGAFDSGIRVARAGYHKVLPFVERVQRRSPADRAGVRRDDLILSVNGRTVSSVEEYEARLAAASPTQPIELVVRRGRDILSLRIDPPEDGP